ncbi:hypothetical protein IWZ01DRAFT_163120 [Phyllosticta capitalensis]
MPKMIVANQPTSTRQNVNLFSPSTSSSTLHLTASRLQAPSHSLPSTALSSLQFTTTLGPFLRLSHMCASHDPLPPLSKKHTNFPFSSLDPDSAIHSSFHRRTKSHLHTFNIRHPQYDKIQKLNNGPPSRKQHAAPGAQPWPRATPIQMRPAPREEKARMNEAHDMRNRHSPHVPCFAPGQPSRCALRTRLCLHTSTVKTPGCLFAAGRCRRVPLDATMTFLS